MTIKLSDYACQVPLFPESVVAGQQIAITNNHDATVTISTDPLLATKTEFDAHVAASVISFTDGRKATMMGF